METSQKIPILIADDHALIRAGLRIVINNSERYNVAGEAGSSVELIRLLEAEQGDVVILDLQMDQPGQGEGENFKPLPPAAEESADELFRKYSGLYILRYIRHYFERVRVLIITQHDDPYVIDAAEKLQVDGFLLKDELNDAIIKALDVIQGGERAFSERVRRIKDQPRPAVAQPQDPLSPREREVLQLVAHGFRDKEISERLNIALRTVAFHKANIKEKLGAESTAEIIAHYYSHEKSFS